MDLGLDIRTAVVAASANHLNLAMSRALGVARSRYSQMLWVESWPTSFSTPPKTDGAK